MASVIKVEKLRKTYRTHKRDSGLKNAFKSLFTREYEIKHALKDVNFEVEEGEILGFIGPNGAGKSTTIKALSGVLYPTSGEVIVLGFVPWKDRIKYVANIGVVFGQKSQLWWDLPPLDTFEMHKDLYNIPEKAFRRRLKKMIRVMDIGKIVKTPVRDLSLGERMKCQIVAALLHNPKLVFLDEPSIGLDVIAKTKLRDFIREINKKFKTTFIVTTHDMGDIERLCKRIIIINHGQIIYDGPLKDIKQRVLQNKVIDVKVEKSSGKFSCKGCKEIGRAHV